MCPSVSHNYWTWTIPFLLLFFFFYCKRVQKNISVYVIDLKKKKKNVADFMNLNSMILQAQEIRSIEATSTSKICWSWSWRGSTWILGWYRHSLKMCSAPSQWGRWAAQMKADRWFELLGEPEEDERSLDKPEQWLRLLPQAKKCHMHTEGKKSFNIALAIKSKAHW